MKKFPTHLEKILRVIEYDDRGTMSGKIVCECGCETFGIKYFGENYAPHCLGVQKVEEQKYACVVKADCRNCGKEWLIFDFAKHAYDGLICEDGVTVPDERLVTAVAGEEHNFRIEISIEFDDEEQFTEEVVDNPPEGMSFAPDDRVNIWSWVVIDLKCVKSGKVLKDFVNIELA